MKTSVPPASASTLEPVAIIGIGCRLPGGVASPADLLNFLSAHGDGVIDVPKDRWSSELYYDPNPDTPGKAYVNRGGFLQQNIFEFDPAPFGISPREADRLDPQQRLLLEATWEALEDAATPIERIRGTNTSVFVGGFTLDHQNLGYCEENRRLLDTHTAVGASQTVLSNRISYTLDLHGPSMTVDTGCSSSLVATHLAYRSVAYDGCELSIVGGVSALISPATTITMCKGHFLAADGRSKTFEASADGYGRGEGVGIVILKRLSSAVRDGDRIYAVIRATGVNQDGRTEAMPVPSEEAQRRLADSVRQAAGLLPGDIGYVEAHGTGTRVGDPIEARAIGSVYGRDRSGPVRIGSIKTNVGHLEAGAGVTGLIKAALSVHTRSILPVRTFTTPNPDIPFDKLGLKVAAVAEPWPLPGVAHAAVNSFGYGGTNAHVIVSEWPKAQESCRAIHDAKVPQERAIRLVPVSAASAAALSAQASQLATAVGASTWQDQAYTLARHRSHFAERLVVLASSGEELAASLARFAQGETPATCVVGRASSERKLLWVFTGMGPQWFAMGRELYQEEPTFRAAVDAADTAFAEASGFSILREMQREEASSEMRTNRIAQPANFVVQVGLVAMLRALGVPCHGVLGHSIGELAAAWAAGCLSLEQAAFVAFHRSRIQQKAAGQGTMLAVGLGGAEANALLQEMGSAIAGAASIATFNSPKSVTLAGERAALERIAAVATEREVFNRMMTVEVAYHSPQMDPFEREFLESFAGLTSSAPSTPLYSTVRGTREAGSIHDADYFWQNARLPVLLQPTLELALDDGYDAFLEIGPHPVLAGAIREVLEDRGKDGRTFFCLKRKQPEQSTLLHSVAELHVAGVPVDFAKLFPTGATCDLPHYPFQRARHWVESEAARETRTGRENPSPMLLRKDSGPTQRFSCDLARPALRYLEDHRIQGTVVFPAAGYVEAALEASLALSEPDAAQVLEDFRFKRALVLRPLAGPELVVDVADDATAIHFFAHHGEDPWERPAEVRLLRGARVEARSLDIAALRAEHTEVHDPAAVYARLAAIGLEYGPRFHALREVRILRKSATEGTVLARLRPLDPSERSEVLHPVLLDGGFQALLSYYSDASQPVLPVSIAELRWAGKSEAPVWAYGRVRMLGTTELIAELALVSEQGIVLADLRGLVCRAVDRRSNAEVELRRRLFHRDAWEPGAWPAPTPAGGAAWALVGTARRFLAALGDLLASFGIRATCVENPTRDALAGCATVVFAAEPEAADVASVEACAQLLNAAKAVKNLGGSLRVVTFGAQAVLPGESADPGQAALSGLCRVVMTEWPELGCRVVDLDATAGKMLASVAALLSSRDREEEVALRGSDLYVRRLRRDESLAPVPDELVSAHDFPGAFVLKHEDDTAVYVACDRTTPGDGQVEIQVFAASADRGHTPWNPTTPTFRGQSARALRTDSVAGRVLRIGPGVSELREGDLVHVLAPGEIKSHVVAAASGATRLLRQHAVAEATAYGPYFAAWHALFHVARLGKDDVLFVNGASSALGLAAVNIARSKGARVVATVSEGAPQNLLHADGVEAIEIADDLDGATKLRDRAGRIDVVLNTIDDPSRDRAMAVLRPGACFLDLAPTGTVGLAVTRSLTYAAVNLGNLSVERPERYAAVAREVLDALARGELRLPPFTLVPAREVASLLPPRAATDDTASTVLDLADKDLSIRQNPADKPLFRADRTYLVTGGLTGFGLATAEWLVAEGARSVVLGSRRGRVDIEAAPTLERVRAQGALVHVVTLDVSSRTSIDGVLAKISAAMPLLAGIFHSATLLEDRPLGEVDRASLERVVGAKAVGAWHLHEASRDVGLDYFVLYSSVSALVGNPNQATYAAANTFLDGLAAYRRSRGLPGTTVSWGALGNVGLVARDAATGTHLRGLGLTSIPASRALAALKTALLHQCVTVGIIDVNWDTWTSNYPDTPWNRLKHLREESGADPMARLRAELEPLPSDAQKKHVHARVAEEVASVLHTDAERLDAAVPLRDMGLDSLMAVELGLALQAAVGVSVPTLQLVGGASVATIAQRTLDGLNATAKGTSARAPSLGAPSS